MGLLKKLFSTLVLVGMGVSPVYAIDKSLPDENSQSELRTLVQSINGTLQTNRVIKVLQENRTAAEENLSQAKAGWGPRVDVRGNFGGSADSSPTSRDNKTTGPLYAEGSASVTLTQPVWDGFATRSRVNIAEATKDSISDRIYDNATTLALDAIIAHIDLIRLRHILDLSQVNVDKHQDLLVAAREREEFGADTMADVSKAEGRLSRALSSLADAKARLLEGEAGYKRITGLASPINLEPVQLPIDMFATPTLVLESAEINNPKIKAYIDDIRAAQGGKELAEAAFHPTVNIEAGSSYSDTAEGEYFQQHTQSYDIKGVFSWNIFNSGADLAATRASSAQVRQARQTMYNFMDDLILEVKNTWTGYENAKELYTHYSDALYYNQLTVDAYTEQFYAGHRSLLDVLDGESELYSSATQAATASSNILVSGYRLYGLAANLLSVMNVDTSMLNDDPRTEDTAPIMKF